MPPPTKMQQTKTLQGHVPGDQGFPSGCVLEATSAGDQTVKYYAGSPFADNGYTAYTGNPFTPACKNPALCDAGVVLNSGSRVLTVKTSSGVVSTDLTVSPTFEYTMPECADSSSTVNDINSLLGTMLDGAAGDGYGNDVVNCIGRCEDRDDDDLTDQEWKTRRNKHMAIGLGIVGGLCCCFIVIINCD